MASSIESSSVLSIASPTAISMAGSIASSTVLSIASSIACTLLSFAVQPCRVVRQDLGVPVLEVRGIAPVVHCDRLISLCLARVGLILFRHTVETGGVPVRRGERLSSKL